MKIYLITSISIKICDVRKLTNEARIFQHSYLYQWYRIGWFNTYRLVRNITGYLGSSPTSK